MSKSAGILLYKWENNKPFFLLVHPGGPFWKNKDLASWSIPKGEFSADESALSAAIREFFEETGLALKGEFTELDPIKQKSGKTVYCWAHNNNFDTAAFFSNTFEMEWPPKSGIMKSFPEVDKCEWFSPKDAIDKILPAQFPLLHQCQELFKLY